MLHCLRACRTNVKRCNSDSRKTDRMFKRAFPSRTVAMQTLKKALTIVAIAASLFILSPTAHAQASSGWWSRVQSWWERIVQQYRAKQDAGDARAVPELDPDAAGGALVLLVGGVAYIVSRRREEEDLV
jgi:hypothetical protein